MNFFGLPTDLGPLLLPCPRGFGALFYYLCLRLFFLFLAGPKSSSPKNCSLSKAVSKRVSKAVS